MTADYTDLTMSDIIGDRQCEWWSKSATRGILGAVASKLRQQPTTYLVAVQFIAAMDGTGITNASSNQIGLILGMQPATVRKHLSKCYELGIFSFRERRTADFTLERLVVLNKDVEFDALL